MFEETDGTTTETTKVTKKAEVVACGCCGRRIQPHQAVTKIYNTRYKNYEHYHEDYHGCYESTRENPPMQRNRMEPWLNIALAGGKDVVFPHYTSEEQEAQA